MVSLETSHFETSELNAIAHENTAESKKEMRERNKEEKSERTREMIVEILKQNETKGKRKRKRKRGKVFEERSSLKRKEIN